MPLKPYDEQVERKDIKLRYERAFACLVRTLPHLQNNTAFVGQVEQLRLEGWNDWHILQSIMSAVITWHLERVGEGVDSDAVERGNHPLVRRLLFEGEGPGDPPVPPEYFTIDRMHALLNAGVMHFLLNKGANFGPRGYDQQMMHRIAATRYHYFELDEPHAPVFPAHASTDISDEERLPTEKQ